MENVCTCDEGHDPHPCPYDVFVDEADEEDQDTWCTCCPYCTEQCEMNI